MDGHTAMIDLLSDDAGHGNRRQGHNGRHEEVRLPPIENMSFDDFQKSGARTTDTTYPSSSRAKKEEQKSHTSTADARGEDQDTPARPKRVDRNRSRARNRPKKVSSDTVRHSDASASVAAPSENGKGKKKQGETGPMRSSDPKGDNAMVMDSDSASKANGEEDIGRAIKVKQNGSSPNKRQKQQRKGERGGIGPQDGIKVDTTGMSPTEVDTSTAPIAPRSMTMLTREKPRKLDENNLRNIVGPANEEKQRNQGETNANTQTGAMKEKKPRTLEKRDARSGEEQPRSIERQQKAETEKAIVRAITIRRMEEALKAEQVLILDWMDLKSYSTDPPDEENASLELLGRQIEGLWKSTRPLPQTLDAREQLIDDVQRALERRWPSCGLRVKPFGSTLTGLVEASSDVDLCLLDPTRPNGTGTPAGEVLSPPPGAVYGILDDAAAIGISGVPDYYKVRLLGRALEHSFNRGKFQHVECIAHASVPIVKFIHAPTGLSCDLNVNDTFGLHNSAMIRAYLDWKPRILEPFVFCIKKWAAKRGINDPAGQDGMASLNSYTIVLAALQWLQVRGVVPNLQDEALLYKLQTPVRYVWQRPKVSRSRKGVKPVMTSDDQDGEQKRIEVDESSGARKFYTSFASVPFTDDESNLSADVIDGIRSASFTGQPLDVRRIKDDRAIHAFLGSSLVEFFRWLDAFDFDQCGFSLREGRPIRRVDHLDDKSQHLTSLPYVRPWDPTWVKDAMLCQDPFILDRNTTRAIHQPMRKIIGHEIRRAKDILTTPPSSSLLPAFAANTPFLCDLLQDCAYEETRDYQASKLAQWSLERQNEVKEAADKLAHTSRQMSAEDAKVSRKERWKSRKRSAANTTTTATVGIVKQAGTSIQARAETDA